MFPSIDTLPGGNATSRTSRGNDFAAVAQTDAYIPEQNPQNLSCLEIAHIPLAMAKSEPKRRNPAQTRARILDAAFELFSTHGYSQTGIREISVKAGVASSLVIRYFNSKSELFHNALVNAIFVRGFFPRDKKDFGVRMARMIMSEKDAQIPSMMALAIGDPEARVIARKVTRRIVLETLEDWLGEPDAHARALNMIILMNGFALQTTHLLEGSVPQATIDWFSQALQAIVDGGTSPT